MGNIAINKVMVATVLAGLCPNLSADKIGDALSVLTGEKQAVF